MVRAGPLLSARCDGDGEVGVAVAERDELRRAWCCCLPDIVAFLTRQIGKYLDNWARCACVCLPAPVALCLSHPSTAGPAGRRVLCLYCLFKSMRAMTTRKFHSIRSFLRLHR